MAKRKRPGKLERPQTAQQVPASFTIQGQVFSGPIPPPEILAKYNEIIPNGADRILAMAERQSTHRQNLEARIVRGNLRMQFWGATFGFILAMIAIIGGIYLIQAGQSATGLVTVISALIGLTGVFIVGRRRQERERIQKEQSFGPRESS